MTVTSKHQLMHRIIHIATVFLLLPVSLTLHAEGAVRLIDCTSVRLCDEAGICETSVGEHAFRMEPVEVDLDGAGTWTMDVDGELSSMQSLSDAGPFYWQTEGGLKRHTLIASSETRFVWHRLDLQNGPETTVVFMQCEIIQ